MDEETQVQAENIQAVEDNSPTTSPVEETQTSESTETAEQPSSAEETVETQEVDTERKPSRSERRIRELSAKVRQNEQQNQLAQSFQQPQQAGVEPGQELTMEQYQQHVAQAAQGIASQTVQQALAQEKARSNFSVDIETLPTQFEELNEKSPNYVPELEKAISQEFEDKGFRIVGLDPITGQPIKELDPSVRLADVAKRYVNVARAAATKSSAEMKNAVAKTADEAAVRPTGSKPATKSFEEMSIKEMEANLGFHNV